MSNNNYPKFPCRIWVKNVHDKDKAVQCNLCKLWIHIKLTVLTIYIIGIFKTVQNKLLDNISKEKKSIFLL